MGKIEWAMWANEQAIASCSIIILGGILGIAGFFTRWQFGIYAIIAGIVVFIFEYPRGKRLNGKTEERLCQQPLTRILSCCGPLSRNYFARFIMHLILCIPLCFILATILGGISLFITSIIYLVAAFKGEEWKPVGLDEETEEKAKKDAKSFRQPRIPPPRAPPAANRF